MNLIDTHCHLDHDPLATAPAEVLARARDRGVGRVVLPAYDVDSWPRIARLTGDHNRIFPAFGLHPWVADQALSLEEDAPCPPGGTEKVGRATISPRDLYTNTLGDRLAAFVAEQRDTAATPPVALGEIGLDHKLDTYDPELQLQVLKTQLELAVDLDLPVILHCRGAFAELLAEIERFGSRLRGVLHAWSRGPELAAQFIKAGLFLGLGGAVTRDRAKRVRRAAVRLPLESFVLETDAPSIGLEGVLPAETEPHHVRDIAATLATLRDEPLETVAEVTTANACRLFRLQTGPAQGESP